MKRLLGLLFLSSAVVFLSLSSAQARQASHEWGKAQEMLSKAMSEIALPKGDRNLLVLTNAGYGQIGAQSTEGFIDMARQATGCSLGSRSLLTVHTSLQEPLWCSIYRKDTGKLVFFKWTGAGFEQQVIDADPTRILIPEGWKAASSGLIGQKLFSVVSISLTWSVEPPWTLLLAATFHDHFCPGVNSGYIAGQYLMQKMPLGPGDQYVFITAPGKCAADALQVMFNTTAGKSLGYTMAIGDEALTKYASGKVQPSIVAMQVNRKSDTCKGIVMGFDWNKAYEDTGVKAEDMAPQGGPGNPMFWIARVKMSQELARMQKASLLAYIKELKQFSGKAGLADKVAGGDPYALVWNQ
jgi:formylmethanofuran dehydrogenase subunit E-like metal-binding protein